MAEPNSVNQLIATTLQNYHKQFADNVSNSNAVTALLREGNRIRIIEGGRQIATPLTYAEETFAWYAGTELLSRATKETSSEAEYAPANAVASVTLSGPDLAKNRSKERILNLLEGKLDNAEATMLKEDCRYLSDFEADKPQRVVPVFPGYVYERTH